MKPENPIDVAERSSPVARRVIAEWVRILRQGPRPHGNARPMFDKEGGRLFKASEAARMIGCYRGTIGRWARDGWIPKSRRKRFHAFTLRQVYLLAKFHDVPSWDHDARSEVSKMIHECW